MADPVHEWIEQYREGRIEALGLLVEHFRRPLFGFILNMISARGDAEDIFQEVWFRAIRRLDQYREKSFLSWLFRIAHNLVIDQARKQKPVVNLDGREDDQGESWTARIPAGGLAPAAEADARELGGRIRAAVGRLSEDQREVFLLRMEGDIPFKDIARIQGVSINTALGRMQYALARLREELKADYEPGVKI